MSREGEPSLPVPLRDVIQSQHPGISDEIDGAIKTLRKLKQLADSDLRPPAPPPPGSQDAGSTETVEVTTAMGASAASVAGSIDRTEAEPSLRREAPKLAAGSTFGRYQIVRLLGQGAMGAVYLAYDSQLQRHVAIKTPFLGENTTVIDRFYREARSAAQLRSPYLCPVYDVGQVGGVTYLSLAFIDGESLTAAAASGRLSTLAQVADVIRKVAVGLQKAHDLGIIHRDLKPDNIMIDRDGEPIVMDFGLARRADDLSVTMPGTVLGTPAYMSPEQVEGDASKVGPPTDVYSLGVILYQLLAGRLPFQGSLASVLRQIGDKQPARPSTFNPAIGDDSPLEQICLKMMAKSPADRFASMAAVAEALGNLSARDGPPVVKASMWAQIASWPSMLRSSRNRTGGTAGLGASRGDDADPNQQTVAGP